MQLTTLSAPKQNYLSKEMSSSRFIPYKMLLDEIIALSYNEIKKKETDGRTKGQVVSEIIKIMKKKLEKELEENVD